MRAAIGLSDLFGRPGIPAVESWPVEHFVTSILVLEATEAARRYEARRRIAENSVR